MNALDLHLSSHGARRLLTVALTILVNAKPLKLNILTYFIKSFIHSERLKNVLRILAISTFSSKEI